MSTGNLPEEKGVAGIDIDIFMTHGNVSYRTTQFSSERYLYTPDDGS
jgi:hypothetical protein